MRCAGSCASPPAPDAGAGAQHSIWIHGQQQFGLAAQPQDGRSEGKHVISSIAAPKLPPTHVTCEGSRCHSAASCHSSCRVEQSLPAYLSACHMPTLEYPTVVCWRSELPLAAFLLELTGGTSTVALLQHYRCCVPCGVHSWPLHHTFTVHTFGSLCESVLNSNVLVWYAANC
jgi:hypothetical protein